jgi:pyruvate,water dikinase
MSLIADLKDITEKDRDRVGGKFYALATLLKRGLSIPKAICISTNAYQAFIQSTGLTERIRLEIGRKRFEDMRWEEVWDTALRIRNMFANTSLPPDLAKPIREAVATHFGDKRVVVRSSAPAEDSAQASFAGLHESYVNVEGVDAIVEHVQKVWASLWSDAALLYRRELALDIETSSMAVIIQEIVVGECSGVVFGRSPQDASQAVIESVWGLNQGLVDGTVEPDNWVLERSTGKIINHTAPKRTRTFVPSVEGVRLVALDPHKSGRPPLDAEGVEKVYRLVMRAEDVFGGPQDVEWTFLGDDLYTLQSRPITTLEDGQDDDRRPWYLSLRRSLENLKTLRNRIENELIPDMITEGSRLAQKDLSTLSDRELADEVEQRKSVYDHWIKIYWRDFIPFAHGMRLFGQVYNDVIGPSDPYEFMDLLGTEKMLSLERNRKLEELASIIAKTPQLAEELKTQSGNATHAEFAKKLDEFLEAFGDLSWEQSRNLGDQNTLISVLLQLAEHPPSKETSRRRNPAALRDEFFARFGGERRDEAAELLDLGRASYRLRDDDNIHLGKIEGQMLLAVNEAKRRVDEKTARGSGVDRLREIVKTVAKVKPEAAESFDDISEEAGYSTKPRQLLGQPAGPGISQGPARVIASSSDLADFKAGEILVCDSIDPNMTFLVPLSKGIVERRGGMLIHGAIIAREYGLPCVTGIPNATDLIHTGDPVTVDGYLGIVIIG